MFAETGYFHKVLMCNNYEGIDKGHRNAIQVQ